MTELNERGRTAPFNFPIEDKSEKIIKVIGDGGGGNAVQHMWDERVKDVSFFVSVSKASGEKRLLKAMTEAISSPLIANVEKLKTRRLLYIVYSGKKGPAKMDDWMSCASLWSILTRISYWGIIWMIRWKMRLRFLLSQRVLTRRFL